MPKRIAIAEHLSSEELYRRYREATDIVERSHLQNLKAVDNRQNTIGSLTGDRI